MDMAAPTADRTCDACTVVVPLAHSRRNVFNVSPDDSIDDIAASDSVESEPPLPHKLVLRWVIGLIVPRLVLRRISFDRHRGLNQLAQGGANRTATQSLAIPLFDGSTSRSTLTGERVPSRSASPRACHNRRGATSQRRIGEAPTLLLWHDGEVWSGSGAFAAGLDHRMLEPRQTAIPPDSHMQGA
jgi:hypothetical protein